MGEPSAFRAQLLERAKGFESLRQRWNPAKFRQELLEAAPHVLQGDISADATRARRTMRTERAREAFFRMVYGVVDPRCDSSISAWIAAGEVGPPLRTPKDDAPILLAELRARGVIEPIHHDRVLRELELHAQLRNAKALAAALYRLSRDGHARPVAINVRWLRWLDALIVARGAEVRPSLFDEARIARAIDALGT
jgi:hypothetical protein